jgi:hypothetical protein
MWNSGKEESLKIRGDFPSFPEFLVSIPPFSGEPLSFVMISP